MSVLHGVVGITLAPPSLLLLIGAGVLLLAVVILVLRLAGRQRARHARTPWRSELPTWGGTYRASLAQRAAQPSRLPGRVGGGRARRGERGNEGKSTETAGQEGGERSS